MKQKFSTPFVFFGTSRFSVILLEELKNKFDIVPELIVTAPDRPVGRKQIITPPPAKDWAIENDIATFQPESLNNEELIEELENYSLFIVASYGKIIPKGILDIVSEKDGTLNVHPSLLPKYRGASPIQNQILNDEKHVGTSIMLMDEKMDHGPILAQKEVEIRGIVEGSEFLGDYNTVEEKLAIESAALLEKVLVNRPQPVEQHHDESTFTKIIKKEDGEITLSDDPTISRKNYLKYLAYSEWPKTFFFFEDETADSDIKTKKRAIITEAAFEENKFIIKKVIPEGRNEMSYENFLSMTQAQ